MGSYTTKSNALGKYKFKISKWDLAELTLSHSVDIIRLLRDNDISDGFKEKMDTSITKEQSFDNSITARKGKGKSELILFARDYYCKRFEDLTGDVKPYNEDTLFFNVNQAVNFFHENEDNKNLKKECVHIDERGAITGMGSFTNPTRLINLTEQTRKNGINWFYASPSLRFGLSNDFVIEPIAIDFDHEVTWSIVRNRTNTVILGSLYTGRARPSIVKSYDVKKDEWLERVQTGNVQDLLGFDSLADEVIKGANLIEKMEKYKEYMVDIEEYRLLTKQDKETVSRPIKPLVNVSKKYIENSITRLYPHLIYDERSILSDVIFEKLDEMGVKSETEGELDLVKRVLEEQ